MDAGHAKQKGSAGWTGIMVGCHWPTVYGISTASSHLCVFLFPVSILLRSPLGINHSVISLLILFLLTSCYHFVVPFTPPFTRFEIAFWAKLQFISTSWQRYAELIAGCKWTSQQNQLARAWKWVDIKCRRTSLGSSAKIIYSLLKSAFSVCFFHWNHIQWAWNTERKPELMWFAEDLTLSLTF